MGYSITQEQWERLEALRRIGRRCAMNTGRGGCFATATYEEDHESWVYEIGEGRRDETTMVFCGRHRNEVGYEGRNFRVLAVRKLPRLPKGTL